MNEYQAYATACIERLQQWYDWKTGLWTSTGWWNAANCLEAVIDYSRLTRTDRYHAVITNTFEKHQQGQFLNQYYDDEQWWALTWLKAYDLLQDRRYLSMASQIFRDVCSGWDAVCGGGLWWKKNRTYKNAITNELFLTLAACLCQRTHDEQYLSWALKECQWFLQTGLLNERHLINDGLTQDCRNNAQPTWTYNQGVILGGIVELQALARDPTWGLSENTVDLAIAVRIADAALSTLSDANGILREPCEQEVQGCGQDGPQFKGIFLRYLSLLAHTLGQEGLGPATYTRYQQFVLTNADVLWRNNRLPALNAFGLHWSGPVDSTDAARQTSALDAFNAACLLTTLTRGCDHARKASGLSAEQESKSPPRKRSESRPARHPTATSWKGGKSHAPKRGLAFVHCYGVRRKQRGCVSDQITRLEGQSPAKQGPDGKVEGQLSEA